MSEINMFMELLNKYGLPTCVLGYFMLKDWSNGDKYHSLVEAMNKIISDNTKALSELRHAVEILTERVNHE